MHHHLRPIDSAERKPVEEVGGEAAARVGDEVTVDEGRAANRAIEVEVVEPSVEAALVEHVAAVEHTDLVPIP